MFEQKFICEIANSRGKSEIEDTNTQILLRISMLLDNCKKYDGS